MIVWAVETLRQCLKVSSDLSVNLIDYAEGLGKVPRRLVFINAETAPSFDNARIVTTISGELVVKMAMKSPFEIPSLLNNAANRLTSKQQNQSL
jgi:hypothetical protein